MPLPASTTSPDAVAGSASRSGASLALVSMLCVQLGVAVAVGLIDQIGPQATAWLRLAWAALILLAVVRPRRIQFSAAALRSCVLLGVVTGAMTMLFMEAVARLPLGTASALEFLGPLGVAIARGRGARLAWPVLAGAGVLLLTEPWGGSADPIGVAFALGAACCWAAYILLTQRAGDQVEGFTALAVSIPVAAVATTIVAGPGVLTGLTPQILLAGLGLAILLPVVPFALELLALRQLTTAAFGTLMALEPALALLIGLVALHQVPGWPAVLGVGLVVAAGVGAERTGSRAPVTPPPPAPVP
ncbi:EamA family transporter [Nocardioides sp. GXZ039]|uniref:EamA family transporter n=1 Tax=Nocardioides sp. GXZ039 TaxID=3136018 RepID=UPI0030F493D2